MLSHRLPGFTGPFPPPLLIRCSVVVGYYNRFFICVKGFFYNKNAERSGIVSMDSAVSSRTPLELYS